MSINQLKRYEPKITGYPEFPLAYMKRTSKKSSYVKLSDIQKSGCCTCTVVNTCMFQYGSVSCKEAMEAIKR